MKKYRIFKNENTEFGQSELTVVNENNIETYYSIFEAYTQNTQFQEALSDYREERNQAFEAFKEENQSYTLEEIREFISDFQEDYRYDYDLCCVRNDSGRPTKVLQTTDEDWITEDEAKAFFIDEKLTESVVDAEYNVCVGYSYHDGSNLQTVMLTDFYTELFDEPVGMVQIYSNQGQDIAQSWQEIWYIPSENIFIEEECSNWQGVQSSYRIIEADSLEADVLAKVQKTKKKMTLKEIKKHFHVSPSLKNKGEYHISSLTERGRFVHKYLTTAYKVKSKFYIDTFEPTGNIDTFIKNVEESVKNKKYDSDYYYPETTLEYKYDIVLRDYIKSLGMQDGYYNNYYTFKADNIYGGKTLDVAFSYRIKGNKIDLSITDAVASEKWRSMSTDFILNEKNPIEQNFDKIISQVDGILKPHILVETARMMVIISKMNDSIVDLKTNELSETGTYIKTKKAELKGMLQSMLDKL